MDKDKDQLNETIVNITLDQDEASDENLPDIPEDDSVQVDDVDLDGVLELSRESSVKSTSQSQSDASKSEMSSSSNSDRPAFIQESEDSDSMDDFEPPAGTGRSGNKQAKGRKAKDPKAFEKEVRQVDRYLRYNMLPADCYGPGPGRTKRSNFTRVCKRYKLVEGQLKMLRVKGEEGQYFIPSRTLFQVVHSVYA